MEEGRLLVVKRGRPPGRGLWAVPGGKVKWGETLREAARREAWEETGLEVEIGEVIWAGEVIGAGPEFHFVLIDFMATVVGGELRSGDDAEEAAWVEIERLRGYPLTGTMPSLLDRLSTW